MMTLENIPTTVIITLFALYEYLRMTLGLGNATQTFERFINNVFRCHNSVHTCADDSLLMTAHLHHLELVFEWPQKYGSTVNIQKYQTGTDYLNTPWWTIAFRRMLPLKSKVATILDYLEMTTFKRLSMFNFTMWHLHRPIVPKHSRRRVFNVLHSPPSLGIRATTWLMFSFNLLYDVVHSFL